MRKEKLIGNMLDQIKEAQIKLGYAEETIRLYYPVESLNAILKTGAESAEEMKEKLEESFQGTNPFGQLHFEIHEGRIEIRIPPEGAKYVHESVETPNFLADLIVLFQKNHHCQLADIQSVFEKYSSDYVCEQMPAGSEFDYVLYFKDTSIDGYYYCVKMEMEHTIYHRFLPEDYYLLY